MQDEGTGSRFREDVGGRETEGNEATTGTPVITADGKRAGTVDGVDGKYIRVASEAGDDYWLSVTAILSADRTQVTLNFDAQALSDWALAEPNGADAADPRIDEQADSLTSERDKVRRREGLVR